MAVIDSRKKLKEYCLKRLGQDVITVEVSDQQVEDRIDDCLQLFKLYHYDGAEEYNLKKTVRQEDVNRGYIDVPEMSSILEIITTQKADKGNVEVMDDIEWRFMLEYNETPKVGSNTLTDYYITKEYLSTMRYLLTTDQMFTFNSATNRLYVLTRPFRAYASGNLLPELDSSEWVESGCALTLKDVPYPDGSLKGNTMTDISGGTTQMSITGTYETKWYARGTYTAEVALMSGTYTGKVALILKDRNGAVIKRQVVQPKNYWNLERVEGTARLGNINDITLTIETVDIPTAGATLAISTPAAYRNNFYIFNGYRDVDTEEFTSIWDIQWIKDYATQLIKQQWGTNLKKYDGVQMVGGTTVNGQTMYDEATEEIKELKEELELKYTLPIDMMWG